MSIENKLKQLELDLAELKQAFRSPRQFLEDYFTDLTQQINTESNKYIELQQKAFNKHAESPTSRLELISFSKDDLEADIAQTNQFVSNLTNEIVQFKEECLQRVGNDFKFNNNDYRDFKAAIKRCEERINDASFIEQLDYDRIDEIDDIVYEMGLRAQNALFNGKCFLLITSEIVDDDVPFCCLVFVSDGFIGKKGAKKINEIYRSKHEKPVCTYKLEFYRLSKPEQDSQYFPRNKLYQEDLTIILMALQHRQIGFFDYHQLSVNLTTAHDLQLTGEHITHLADNLFTEKFTNLWHIDLSMNHLKQLPENIFTSLLNLESINLSGNIFDSLDINFNDLTRLKSLDLSYNRIITLKQGVFEKLSNLTYLNFSFNKLAALNQKVLRGLSGLCCINLTHNKLGEIAPGTFQGSKDLKFILLGENSLKEVYSGMFEGLVDLEVLFLNRNLIQKINENAFDGLINVQRLFLQNNRLVELSLELFTGLESLEILDLSWNLIKRIDSAVFKDLLSLIELRLVSNKLEVASGAMLYGLEKLRSVDFSKNLISELDENMFDSCGELAMVSFYDNKLIEIPNGLFGVMNNLERVSLHKNQMLEIDLNEFTRYGVYQMDERDGYMFFLFENDLFLSVSSGVNVVYSQ